ncbi:MAG: phosphoribosyltransferase family protein [Myxococcales bacterium]
MRFHDRVDAGQQLAALLAPFRDASPLVIALPRGGVPVAYEVARALGAPLDVLVVRKLGAPAQPELGLGAIAEGGAVWVDSWLMREVGVSAGELEEIAQREAVELERRIARYRQGRPPLPVEGRTVILVDDGVATGGTARAAIRALREHHPRRLVLAAPVVSAEAARELRGEVDELVCAHVPAAFYAVGAWYEEFPQTSDEEVRSLLEMAREAALHDRPPPTPRAAEPADPQDVAIRCDGGFLVGSLEVPHDAQGIVIFAHGSGSSRLSPRNQHVARVLAKQGLATLLLDLLTLEEEQVDDLTGHLRFDIEFLARRLATAPAWVADRPDTQELPIGYFGASTGAAAALVAAARLPGLVRAIVSRGGRPDLAGAESLAAVRAPTLLIVGGRDEEVLELNREAMAQMEAEHRLAIVPGATHLFAEPGALDTVARLAAGWFAQRLPARERKLLEPGPQLLV